MEDYFQQLLSGRSTRNDFNQKEAQKALATKKRRKANKVARKQRIFNLINS